MSEFNLQKPDAAAPIGFPQIDFIYRHIDKSSGLEEVANKKIFHHLKHLHSAPLSSIVVFSLNGKRHHISLDLKVCSKRNYFCEAEDASMYHAIDMLSQKLGRIVRKHKDQSKPKIDRISDHLIDPTN
jgi:ribosomal subunit interface protein